MARLTGSEVSDLFGRRSELDSASIRSRILEVESRITWITSELDDPKNQSPKTSRYSNEMLGSLDDEKNVLSLYASILYRRREMIAK